MMRAAGAAAAGLAVTCGLGGATVIAAGPAAARFPAAHPAASPAAKPGAPLWVRRYDGPGHGVDVAAAIAVSPGGRTVFVTGSSNHTRLEGSDYATVAYNAVTGRQLWASRYHGPGDNSGDHAQAVGVSPDGRRVFVTGWFYCCSWTARVPMGNYYGTVAYSAATGTQMWARLYPKDPGQTYDMAFALAVSRHGNQVIVAGRPDTVAYSFSGRQLWASRYPGAEPRGVAITPDGNKAFVSGFGGPGYVTIAYNAATGARLWRSQYIGPPGSQGLNWVYAAATSPDGRTVYIAGTSGRFGYATIAYRAATGARIWISRRSAGRYHVPALAVSPRGTLVFLACTTRGDYTTIAYKT